MLEDLLLGIVADPQAEDRYLVLADYPEEHDDPRRAKPLRAAREQKQAPPRQFGLSVLRVRHILALPVASSEVL
jgi:uncharacterized protein (TIGR02996 family)